MLHLPDFYNGQFVTHEILSEKKFAKILADKQQILRCLTIRKLIWKIKPARDIIGSTDWNENRREHGGKYKWFY